MVRSPEETIVCELRPFAVLGLEAIETILEVGTPFGTRLLVNWWANRSLSGTLFGFEAQPASS